MEILFYIFALAAVVGGSTVLWVRNPVYCALSLVGTFSALGVIYVMLNAEFIATVQVLVYAGAIMVLFLFVIMLLSLKAETQFPFRFRLPQIAGMAVSVALFAQMAGLFFSPAAQMGPLGEYTTERLNHEGSVETVGRLLFTDYLLPFEVISVLLLVSVIGAVVLAKRRTNATAIKEGR